MLILGRLLQVLKVISQSSPFDDSLPSLLLWMPLWVSEKVSSLKLFIWLYQVHYLTHTRSQTHVLCPTFSYTSHYHLYNSSWTLEMHLTPATAHEFHYSIQYSVTDILPCFFYFKENFNSKISAEFLTSEYSSSRVSHISLAILNYRYVFTDIFLHWVDKPSLHHRIFWPPSFKFSSPFLWCCCLSRNVLQPKAAQNICNLLYPPAPLATDGYTS